MNRASIITWSIVGGVVVVGGIVAAVAVGASDDEPDASPSLSPTASASASSTPTPTASASPTAEPVDPGDDDSAGAEPGPGASPTAAVPIGPGQPTTEAPAAPAPGTTTASVTPFVAFDQWTAESSTLTIGATVPEIVEQGGVCTLTAVRGAESVSGSFTALPSASSTDCGSMALSSPSFTAGTWTVSVAYASPTAAGTLSDYEVTIP